MSSTHYLYILEPKKDLRLDNKAISGGILGETIGGKSGPKGLQIPRGFGKGLGPENSSDMSPDKGGQYGHYLIILSFSSFQ